MSRVITIEGGVVTYLYTESFDSVEGETTITRASHVEPDGKGGWEVDLSPIGGIKREGFKNRSEALYWEEKVVNYWLKAKDEPLEQIAQKIDTEIEKEMGING